MEKNPECAKELLTWIQDAIATRKLRDPVYSDNGKRNIRAFSKFLNPYGITAKRLRKNMLLEFMVVKIQRPNILVYFVELQ